MPRRSYYCKLCSHVDTTTESFIDHVKSVHDLNIIDYYEEYDIENIPYRLNRMRYHRKRVSEIEDSSSRVSYDNIINEHKVECPYCHRQYGALPLHLKSHNKTSEECLVEYPNTSLVAPKIRKDSSKRLSSTLRRLWSDDDYSRKMSKKMYDQHHNDPDNKLTKSILNRTLVVYTNKNNDSYIMRSSWEVRFAEFLDSNGISYKYESLAIKYEDSVYYPDFYLPQYNLIVEVKPSSLVEDEIVQKKMKAAIEAGYNFQFITEEELESDLSDFISRINS